MSLILQKKVLFLKEVSGLQKKGLFSGIFTEKGLFSVAPSQRFWKKGPFLPFVNVSERGMFLFWRTIIRPPFCM